MRVGDINLPEDQCGEFVCSFIAREGSWFPCALAKYHDGPHHSGGNCFTHGKYATRLPGVPPACPQCDESIKAMSLASIPASLKAEPVSYDPTLVQRRPTAPEGEQDVGMFVINHLLSMHMPEVATDHEKRIEMGEKKYGQRLRTHNGRDALLDLVQELLDGCSYSAQLKLECKDDGSLFHLLVRVTALAEGYWKKQMDSYQELQLWESLLETVDAVIRGKRKNSQDLPVGE